MTDPDPAARERAEQIYQRLTREMRSDLERMLSGQHSNEGMPERSSEQGVLPEDARGGRHWILL